MATKKRKKAIEFQIGWPGLIAIIASTFCVLAWTFVLGFWMGQKLMGGQLTSNPQVTALNPAGPAEKGGSAPAGGLTRSELPAPAAPTVPSRDEAALKALREQLQSSQQGATGGLADLPTEVVGPSSSAKGVAGAPSAPAKGSGIDSPPVPVPAPGQGQGVVSAPSVPGAKEAASKGTSAAKPVKAEPVKAASVKAKAKGKEKGGKKGSAGVAQERVKKADRKHVVLQIASYRDPSRAEKEARRWQSKGYKTRIKKVNLGAKGIWYRLYIGSYSSVEEAKKAAAKLAAREGITSYVVPNP